VSSISNAADEYDRVSRVTHKPQRIKPKIQKDLVLHYRRDTWEGLSAKEGVIQSWLLKNQTMPLSHSLR